VGQIEPRVDDEGEGGMGGGVVVPEVPIDPSLNPPRVEPLDECKGVSRMGLSPMRRLTNLEYANTMRDLLGRANAGTLIASFPPEGAGHGFDNNAETSGIPKLRTQKMFEASRVAANGFDPTKELKCPVSAVTETCVRDFIGAFGTRAYRRPPTTDEVTVLFKLYNGFGAEFSVREKLDTVVQSMLLSPQFNFMAEVGDGSVVSKEVGYVGVSSYELATRLSYFLWGTMPDAELFSAAQSNELLKTTVIQEQVKRMFFDPRARDSVRNFAIQWTEQDRLQRTKDLKVFPSWNQQVASDLEAETATFIEKSIVDARDGWKTLMTDRRGFVTGRTAPIYGVTLPPGADANAVAEVELPDTRPGFLTRAGFLAGFAQAKYPSPIQRGMFVRREFLCQNLGAPPPGAESQTPPPTPAGATNRQIKTAHSQMPQCKSCHQLIDPPGFAFESFDAIGKYSGTEITESGQTAMVDTTGTLIGTDVDGDFKDAGELVGMLARSAEAQTCVVTQWFRYARARLELPDDTCAIADLTGTFNASGGDFAVLFAALATSDGFRFRPVTTN
jgi:Protein of unknown function (DUF1592)/Protein of unknown function (DUF1588)/Protein of unknown function (DUF1587)/Protein of unknown function (DUF1595)/Protein of unknown function (DUF1585)